MSKSDEENERSVWEKHSCRWYVNVQLQGLYPHSCFEVSLLIAFFPSAELLAFSRFYLLGNGSRVKDDKVDVLQAAAALTCREERFVKHLNKFEL